MVSWGEARPMFEVLREIDLCAEVQQSGLNSGERFVQLVEAFGNVGRWLLEGKPEAAYESVLDSAGIAAAWLRDECIPVPYAIQAERLRQQEKWGLEQDNPDGTFYLILGEEVGEVAEAIWLRDKAEILKELIQVAAVCCCWLEFRAPQTVGV